MNDEPRDEHLREDAGLPPDPMNGRDPAAAPGVFVGGRPVPGGEALEPHGERGMWEESQDAPAEPERDRG